MGYFDLDYEISKFSCQAGGGEAESISVQDALNVIKNEEFKADIAKLRGGDSFVKRKVLPTFSFHCRFDGKRSSENVENMSGIIIVDIDDVEVDLIEAIKEDIMAEMESCLAVFTSPSGDGIKALYLVDEEAVTKSNYRAFGKEVAKKFKQYGDTDTLSITDCLICSSDSNLLLNEAAIPDIFIEIKEVEIEKVDLPPLDTTKVLFDDAEEFFEFVLLEQIQERADNNYHFIQMSVFELAKYGMVQDQELSFILQYAPSQSKKNTKRLYESIEKAADVQQVAWAYDLREGSKGLGGEIARDSDDDEFFKNFGDDEPDEDDGFDDEDAEDENFGVVDYSTMWDKFIEVLEAGDRVGEEISLSNFADIFRFKTGLTVVTGIPSSGKTEFVDQCIVDLARLSGWKTGVAGFEQEESEHIMKLVRKVMGFDVRADGADRSEMRNAYNFVTSNIQHVDVEKTGGDIMRILKVFESMINRGFKNFIIDPFNLLTIKIKSGGHEKVNDILQQIVLFCKKNNVSVILIAHPTKMRKDEKTGKFEVPTFYDVKGSSAFYEMAYHGLVVHRDDEDTATPVMAKVLKVKQNNLGERDGKAFFRYQRGSGRYTPVDVEGLEISGDWSEKFWHLKEM